MHLMKHFFLTLLLCSAAIPALAGDLTASSTPSTIGGSTGSVDLTVSGGVAPYTYAWTGPGGFLASTEDIAGLAAGVYVVSVTDLYCGVAVLTVVVDEDSIASSTDPSQMLTSFSAYPNPFSNEIRMRFTSPVQGDALLLLTDAKGQVIYTEEIQLEQRVNEKVLTIAKPLAGGAYFLRIMYQDALIANAKLIHP
jgi:hypothetical protein